MLPLGQRETKAKLAKPRPRLRRLSRPSQLLPQRWFPMASKRPPILLPKQCPVLTTRLALGRRRMAVQKLGMAWKQNKCQPVRMLPQHQQ